MCRAGNGSNDKFSNIIIDGGTKDSEVEFAELIEYIDRRNETIEALILTHIDYDHLQGAISGIAILPEKILRRTIQRILFNCCRGIIREQGGIGKNCAEDVLKGQIPTEGWFWGAVSKTTGRVADSFHCGTCSILAV